LGEGFQMKSYQQHRFWLGLSLGMAVAMTIFGFRLWAIFNYGLAWPLNDEWFSEWHTLYAPYLNHNLTLSDFMWPNDVHNIALQKCFHLAVFVAAGEWNPMLLMVLNAALFALLCGFLTAETALVLEPIAAVAGFAVFTVLLGCLPAAGENFLWGFQTGWYLYYFLSLLTCWCAYSCRVRPWLFGLGIMSALLSTFCLGAGLINIGIAIIPLVRDAISFLRRRAVIGWQFCINSLFAIGAIGIYFCIVGPGHNMPAKAGVILGGLVGAISWPAPWGFFPATQLGTVIVLLAELWWLRTDPVYRMSFHIYLMAWALSHIIATVTIRGELGGRHMELLYWSLLSTLFGCAVVKQRVRSIRAHRLVDIWFWIMLGCILLRFGVGFRGFDYWKEDWLKRYQPVFAYLLSGDPKVITGKTFDHDQIVSTWLASNPETLRTSSLGEALPSLPIQKLWEEQGVDTNVNYIAARNVAPPHAYILWRRVDGPHEEVLPIHAANSPYLKLNIYGALDFDAFEFVSGSNVYPLTHSMKVAFGQPPGWLTVFLRTPPSPSDLRLVVKPKPGAWVILQTPTACSWLQYMLELFGRRAEILISLGLFGLLLVLSLSLATRLQRQIEVGPL